MSTSRTIGSIPSATLMLPSRSTRSPQKHYINHTDAYTVGTKLDLIGRDFLLVAEGNGSFARSWEEQHSQEEEWVAARMLVTDYLSYEDMQKNETSRKTISYLTERGAQFAYGVDMGQLDSYFPGHRFCRIQANCPNDRKDYYQIPPTLPPLMKRFVLSARSLQQKGDTLHITLPQPGSERCQAVYQAHHFGLGKAIEGTDYEFMTKVPFNPDRYPGYEHIKTNSTESAHVARFNQEFIFRLGDPDTKTPPDRLGEISVILKHGLNTGQPFQCNYYTTISPDLSSPIAFPRQEPFSEHESQLEAPATKRRKSTQDEDESPMEIVLTEITRTLGCQNLNNT